MKTTWRKEIEKTMRYCRDSFDNVIAVACEEGALDIEFDDGYGLEEGKPFTVWTKTRVYFPICYDEWECAGSAPRNPCIEAMGHQGGG